MLHHVLEHTSVLDCYTCHRLLTHEYMIMLHHASHGKLVKGESCHGNLLLVCIWHFANSVDGNKLALL